jgi:hypothetical protein
MKNKQIVNPRPEEPELEDGNLEDSEGNIEIAGRAPNLGELDDDPDELQ